IQSTTPPIARISRSTEIPSTQFQKACYFWQLMNPESALYNALFVYQHKGDVNEAWLRQSIESVVRSNEVLRTNFTMNDDRVAQVILPPSEVTVDLGVSDL